MWFPGVRLSMHNRQTTHDAEHPFVSSASVACHIRTIFDSGILMGGHDLRQPFVIASFCAPVEVAARHVVESALSTTERAGAMG